MRECTKGMCLAFIKFMLDSTKIKKLESINQYWKQFKMVYYRYTGRAMDSNLAVEVHNVSRRNNPLISSDMVRSCLASSRKNIISQ